MLVKGATGVINQTKAIVDRCFQIHAMVQNVQAQTQNPLQMCVMVLLLERIGDIASYDTNSTIGDISRRLFDVFGVWLKSDISRLDSNGPLQSGNGHVG